MSQFSFRGVQSVAQLLVANFAALPSVATVPTGTKAYVVDQGLTYVNNGTTWATPNVSQTITASATYYIDPVNGSDDNNGTSSITALKTMAQMALRIGYFPTVVGESGAVNVTINVLGDLPATDPIIFYPSMVGNASFSIVGVTTNLFTGTFTAVTAETPATNTYLQVTDTALPAANSWSAAVGHVITITGGARAGAVGAVVKDQGAKVARLTGLTTAGIFGSTIVPQIGDPYAVLVLTKTSDLLLTTSGNGDSQALPAGVVLLKNLQIAGNSNVDTKLIAIQTQGPIFTALNCTCSNSGVLLAILGNGLFNTLVGSYFAPGNGINLFGQTGIACYSTAFGVSPAVSGSLICRTGTFIQGGGPTGLFGGESGAIYIDRLAIADWSGPGVDITYGSFCALISGCLLFGTSAVASSTTIRIAWGGTKFVYEQSVGITGVTALGQKSGGADVILGHFTASPVYTLAAGFAAVASTLTLANISGGTFSGFVNEPRAGVFIAQAN